MARSVFISAFIIFPSYLPRSGLLLASSSWLGDLDLRRPPVHKEFDASDKAAVIRSEKKDRLGNFFRRAGPPQRSIGGGLRLELLDLLIAQSKLCLIASCNDGAWTHHVHPDI